MRAWLSAVAAFAMTISSAAFAQSDSQPTPAQQPPLASGTSAGVTAAQGIGVSATTLAIGAALAAGAVCLAACSGGGSHGSSTTTTTHH
jgi:hypothetical protein